MKTLITPLQVLRLAFGGGDYLPPDSVTEADIAGAEQRHIIPVVGRSLYEKLLEGSYAGFRDEYLAAPTALFTRLALQSRLDISTGQCGTTAPKTACGQPAGEAAPAEVPASAARLPPAEWPQAAKRVGSSPYSAAWARSQRMAVLTSAMAAGNVASPLNR